MSSRVIHVHVKGWTQTLEASVTSASGVKDGRQIAVDYPVTAVTGVFDNDAGTGTNYWTVYPVTDPRAKRREINPMGRYIVLPIASGLAAATSCWVTYDISSTIQPVYGAFSASGLVVLSDAYTNGVTYNFTGFTEMTSPIAGTPVEVPLDPQQAGMLVKSVKLITDGTDVNFYVYKAAVASYANLIYREDGINLIEIDNSEWLIPIDNTSIWIGYQDVGANATQANTTVEIRGSPIV